MQTMRLAIASAAILTLAVPLGAHHGTAARTWHRSWYACTIRLRDAVRATDRDRLGSYASAVAEADHDAEPAIENAGFDDASS